MSMTMHDLMAARSLTADRDVTQEEDHPMEKPVYADDQTTLAPRPAPRPMVAPPTNHVTVVGYITPQRPPKQERAKKPNQAKDGADQPATEAAAPEKMVATRRVRTQDLGQMVLEEVRLLVMEEDGATYSLDLPLSAVLVQRQRALFQPDARIVVEGYLVNTVKVDRNLVDLEEDAFGHTEQPQGRGERSLVDYQDIAIEVLAVRAATDDDVDGSWVQLRGQTTAAPAFRRMDHDARLFQARTQLLTQLRKPSARAGSRSLVQVDTRLPITVATRLPQANTLYGRGNEVVVEGRLQPFRYQLQTEDVALTQALGRLDAEWADKEAALRAAAERKADKAERQAQAQQQQQKGQQQRQRQAQDERPKTPEEQLRQARRGYLYQRINLQARTKLGIVVTYAELVRGQVVRLEAARQTWTTILQARHDRRLGIRHAPLREQTPAAPVVAAAAPIVDTPSAPGEPAVVIVEPVALPALAVPEKPEPKRRKKVVAVANEAEVTDEMLPAGAPTTEPEPAAEPELAAEPEPAIIEEAPVDWVPEGGEPLPIGDDQADMVPATDGTTPTDSDAVAAAE